MTDLLIRAVPDAVLAAIDQRAKRLGLSRTEFLRRTLAREASRAHGSLTVEDLERFSELAADLTDERVMRQAWE